MSFVVLAFAGCEGTPASPANEDSGVGSPYDGGHEDSGTVFDAGASDASAARHAVLFVGNSYVYVNDVAGHYRTLASALTPNVRVEQVTTGGYRLAQHAEDARTDGTALARWLRTGTAEETSFDTIILQEQSQIGGLRISSAERVASVAAASELSALARARGAMTVLYQTWGYEHGDPTIYGYTSFEDMQERVADGYRNLAALLREQGVNVRVAPVGGGFRTVFEDVTMAGGDPEAKGSDFDALYEADGSHPSLRGAYLASCILAGTVTAADVRSFVDEPTLGPAVSGRLRDVCARTLADPRWVVPTIHRADAVLSGDGKEGGIFGAAVALSANGTRLLVGAPDSPGSAGAGWVFARTASGFSEEARWYGGQGFGSSVALTSDGSRAFLAYPWRAYGRDLATWTEGPSPWSVSTGEIALVADGSRAIVGASGAEASTLVARAFVRSEGTWLEEPLVASEPSWQGSRPSVAIDGAGARAIVGAAGTAVARVFLRTGTGWHEEAALSSKHCSSATPGSRRRVALSADGSRALVGVPELDCVATFRRSAAAWTEEMALRGTRFSRFGETVASSADGKRALVGVPGDAPAATGSASGSASVFSLEDGVFRERLLLLPPSPPKDLSPGLFGASIAMSPDGGSVLIGAPNVGTTAGLIRVGAAYAFTLP